MSASCDTVRHDLPRRASVLRNASALYALQIANYAIPLATLPYLIRALGPDSYGVLSMAYALVFLLVLAVDAGFNTLAARRLARPDINSLEVSATYLANQVIKLFAAALAFLLLVVLSVTFDQIAAHRAVYLCTYPIVIGSLLFPTWLFQGLEVMHLTTVCSVTGRLAATAGILLLVRGPEDLALAALLQASATAVSGCLALLVVVGHLRLSLRPGRARLIKEIRAMVASARTLAPAEFLTNAASNSGVLILGLFATEAAVGAYAAVEKLGRACLNAFQPVVKALLPKLTCDWHREPSAWRERATQWTMRICGAGLLTGLAIAIFAEPVLDILFGETWGQHAALLRTLAAWVVLSIVSLAVANFLLLAPGNSRGLARSLAVSTTIQVVLCLAGAMASGATGLVHALIAAEFLRICLFVRECRAYLNGEA